MKKLKEFIAWVGKQKGFEGMNPDQVIAALNEMSSSKEGKAEVAKLMSTFKQDQKIDNAADVLKAQNGRRFDRAKSKEIMDR